MPHSKNCHRLSLGGFRTSGQSIFNHTWSRTVYAGRYCKWLLIKLSRQIGWTDPPITYAPIQGRSAVITTNKAHHPVEVL